MIVEDPDGRRLMPSDLDESGLSPGTRLGRYIVLETIGAGRMGMVLAAYDPELNRKVALKLMRPTEHDRRRERQGKAGHLLQEAQALARLAHPNVITVYDVGTWEDRVFVAMELVEGDTLEGWLQSEPRRWEQVLAVCISAGRGLAAAHNAGLVHRDFKPENVLVGNDGRVRVMDFGLAAPTPSIDTIDTGSFESPDPPSPSDTSSTSSTSTTIGTPAYIAPEQHRHRGPNPRSDQYSFCVALYRSLYGQVPFTKADAAELLAQKQNHAIPTGPSGSSIPGWIRRILVRGLHPDPTQRWPSMEELLVELTHDPRIARRRWLGLAGLVLLAGGTVGGVLYFRQRGSDQCHGAADLFAEVWNDQRKANAREGLLAAHAMGTDPQWLDDNWKNIEGQLDDYQAAWIQMQTDACEATYHRGEQSHRLLNQRNECLEQRRAQIDALTQILASATSTVAPLASHAVASLSPLSHCADSEVLAAAVDPPPTEAVAQQVTELRRTLARVHMLNAVGLHKDADPLATQQWELAQSLEYAPVEAEARYQLGRIKASLADAQSARLHLREAYWAASSVKHDRLAGMAGSELVQVVGLDLSRLDDGLSWYRHTNSAFTRVGLGPADEAPLVHRVSAVYQAKGDTIKAYQELKRARRLYESLPSQKLALAQVLQDLAAMQIQQLELEQAHASLAQATTLIEHDSGAQHPEIANVLAGQGRLHDAQGKHALARERFDTALALLERSIGLAHPMTAPVYEDLAQSYALNGEFEQAVTMQRQAYTRLLAALGKHPRVAQALFKLGSMRSIAYQPDEARSDWLDALHLWEQTSGHEHPDIAFPLTRLAQLDLDDGQPQQAVERLERALKVRGRKGLHPSLLADTQLALARALYASGDDHQRARELAQSAQATYEQGDPNDPHRAKQLAAIEQWFREIDDGQ